MHFIAAGNCKKYSGIQKMEVWNSKMRIFTPGNWELIINGLGMGNEHT